MSALKEILDNWGMVLHEADLPTDETDKLYNLKADAIAELNEIKATIDRKDMTIAELLAENIDLKNRIDGFLDDNYERKWE